MNKFLTIVVAVVALGTVVASPVRAEKIQIVDFKANRFGAGTGTKNPHIYLSAYLRNNTAGKTKGGKYTFYQTVGNKLVAVRTGNMNELAATGHRENVSVALPYTTVEQRFELKVFYDNETTTAKFTIAPAKSYLTLISLKCKTANEGDDTPELRVYMPGKEHKMRWENVNSGRTLTIKGIKKKEMTRDVSVQLWEIDSGSPDDKIGVVTIKRDAYGEHSLDFRSKEGWYVMKYRVDDEGP